MRAKEFKCRAFLDTSLKLTVKFLMLKALTSRALPARSTAGCSRWDRHYPYGGSGGGRRRRGRGRGKPRCSFQAEAKGQTSQGESGEEASPPNSSIAESESVAIIPPPASLVIKLSTQKKITEKIALALGKINSDLEDM